MAESGVESVPSVNDVESFGKIDDSKPDSPAHSVEISHVENMLEMPALESVEESTNEMVQDNDKMNQEEEINEEENKEENNEEQEEENGEENEEENEVKEMNEEDQLNQFGMVEKKDPNEEIEVTTMKVFVGGVAPATTDASFHTFFKKFGELADWVLMKHPEANKNKGFGFVTYKSKDVVLRVLKETLILDGKELKTYQAIPKDPAESKATNASKKRKEASTVAKKNSSNKPGAGKTNSKVMTKASTSSKRLYVGKLSNNINERELRAHFTKFGVVDEVIIMRDRGRDRVYGFVEYAYLVDADRALSQSKHVVSGISINVERAKSNPLDDRNSSRKSDRRSRSHSPKHRGRSRSYSPKPRGRSPPRRSRSPLKSGSSRISRRDSPPRESRYDYPPFDQRHNLDRRDSRRSELDYRPVSRDSFVDRNRLSISEYEDRKYSDFSRHHLGVNPPLMPSTRYSYEPLRDDRMLGRYPEQYPPRDYARNAVIPRDEYLGMAPGHGYQSSYYPTGAPHLPNQPIADSYSPDSRAPIGGRSSSFDPSLSQYIDSVSSAYYGARPQNIAKEPSSAIQHQQQQPQLSARFPEQHDSLKSMPGGTYNYNFEVQKQLSHSQAVADYYRNTNPYSATSESVGSNQYAPPFNPSSSIPAYTPSSNINQSYATSNTPDVPVASTLNLPQYNPTLNIPQYNPSTSDPKKLYGRNF